MLSTDRRIIEVLEALSPGQAIWLTASGQSMWPVMIAGDRLRVRRCGALDVKPGDIVVVRLGPVLVAHLCRAVDPLVTCGMIGPDDPPGVVLARADAIERRAVRIAIPNVLRRALLALRRAGHSLRRIEPVRALVRTLRDGR